jgi:hypothetical protein
MACLLNSDLFLWFVCRWHFWLLQCAARLQQEGNPCPFCRGFMQGLLFLKPLTRCVRTSQGYEVSQETGGENDTLQSYSHSRENDRWQFV